MSTELSSTIQSLRTVIFLVHLVELTFCTFCSVLETQWVEQGSQQEAFWVAGDQTTSLILLLRGKPQPGSACRCNYRFTSVLGVWACFKPSEASNPSNYISKEF